MTRPRLFVELCCGSAAVTLKLLGGRHAVPPISYMGSKRGYAITILGAMGLRSGIGADSVLLCDAGPWAHVWAVLADEARCHEVAAVLRGWSDEDPRKLWERLREEHRGEWDGWTAERAAGWLAMAAGAFRYGEPESGMCKERWLGAPDRGNFGEIKPVVEWLPTRVESVAAWLQVGAWSIDQSRLAGYKKSSAEGAVDSLGREWGRMTVAGIASRTEGSTPSAPASIFAGNAADVPIPDDCEGVYLYCDPPYHGDGTRKITGYAHDMPREVVMDTLQRWSDAGAAVCCSESVGLADGLRGDWWEVEITGARVGQKRTFSAQSTEIITMNREPAYRPATQSDMFGSLEATP